MKFKKNDRVSVQPNEKQGINRITFGVIDRIDHQNNTVRLKLDNGKGFMVINVCYVTKI